MVGTAIHLAIHAPSLMGLVTAPHVWLGEPPPLVPLSFAAAGCLGLIPLVVKGQRRLEEPPVVHRAHSLWARRAVWFGRRRHRRASPWWHDRPVRRDRRARLRLFRFHGRNRRAALSAGAALSAAAVAGDAAELTHEPFGLKANTPLSPRKRGPRPKNWIPASVGMNGKCFSLDGSNVRRPAPSTASSRSPESRFPRSPAPCAPCWWRASVPPSCRRRACG